MATKKKAAKKAATKSPAGTNASDTASSSLSENTPAVKAPAKKAPAGQEKRIGVAPVVKVTGETAELFLMCADGKVRLHTDLQLAQANELVENHCLLPVAVKEIEAATSDSDVLVNKKEAKYFA